MRQKRVRRTLWVDGAWEGHGTIGAVLHYPVGTFCWGCQVPQDIEQAWATGGSSHLVYHAEIFAIWVSLTTFAGILRNTALLIWEDNEGARFSLTSGSTINLTAALQIHQIWALLAKLDILPWVARVPSASNPADAPSRLQFHDASRLNWTRVQPILPDLSDVTADAATLQRHLQMSE